MTGKEKAFLKKIGNSAKTVVQIGVNGITEQVIQSVEEALKARELIQISIASPNTKERKEMGKEIAKKTESEIIQFLGKTCLLYRFNPEKPIVSSQLKKHVAV
jgi:RNA-binding protein